MDIDFSKLKRIKYEWNIDCEIDGKKNNYEEEHEVYKGVYELDEKHLIELKVCESECDYQNIKLIKTWSK